MNRKTDKYITMGEICKRRNESGVGKKFVEQKGGDKKAWAKKEEEILDSIKKELKQKKKIDLDPNWLREVFILRDKEEYRNQYIEWSRGFLADNIGLALERMNLFKNKAQDIALSSLPYAPKELLDIKPSSEI
ncbi:9649_t:CDS:2, partial [Gigaspora margarita]